MYIFNVLASLWIVQKIKNWNGLKLSCQKKKEKSNTMAVSKKDKMQPNGCKKRPFQNKTNSTPKEQTSSIMFLLIYLS